MIDPDGLVVHARGLAGTGPGRPADVNLRRGVSACYYAVFHDLTAMAVDHVVQAADDGAKASLRRTWTHGELAAAADMLVERSKTLAANPQAKPTKDQAKWGPLVDMAATDADVVAACRLFTELQQQRHAADYDHLASFDKARLLSACQDAEAARGHLRAASSEARQALMTLVVVGRTDFRQRAP